MKYKLVLQVPEFYEVQTGTTGAVINCPKIEVPNRCWQGWMVELNVTFAQAGA